MDSSDFDRHLKLPFDHLLVKLHVALCREEPLRDIHVLHFGVVALPHTYTSVPGSSSCVVDGDGISIL